eukprot:181517-Karenia_brevis.AAC.1
MKVDGMSCQQCGQAWQRIQRERNLLGLMAWPYWAAGWTQRAQLREKSIFDLQPCPSIGRLDADSCAITAYLLQNASRDMWQLCRELDCGLQGAGVLLAASLVQSMCQKTGISEQCWAPAVKLGRHMSSKSGEQLAWHAANWQQWESGLCCNRHVQPLIVGLGICSGMQTGSLQHRFASGGGLRH